MNAPVTIAHPRAGRQSRDRTGLPEDWHDHRVTTHQATEPHAVLGGLVATDLVDLTDDPAALGSSGFWVVVADFDGPVRCARFATVRPGGGAAAAWRPVPRADWTSSLDEAAYTAAVQRIRADVESGRVYQANLCRTLSTPLGLEVDLDGLAARLAAHHPAARSARVLLPDGPGGPVDLAGASPELFLRRDGDLVVSAPIKGTARTGAELLAKDVAENVMITDLVRNDLSRAAATGSVEVLELCAERDYPGLVHLESVVQARLVEGAGWPELLAATLPPGSVSGAPKHEALAVIAELEPAPRGPYCGAVGWVDGDRGCGELGVTIRTFWQADGHLHLGVGAGITWGSDPDREWAETELKAHRLLALAAGGGGGTR